MREFCMSGSARGAVRLSTLGRPYRDLRKGEGPSIRTLGDGPMSLREINVVRRRRFRSAKFGTSMKA